MAAPTIVVTDNRDGTATVTISGDLLHTYDAYARRIDGTMGNAGWVFIGFVALLTPPGVEQFTVPLDKGLYAFYAIELGEISPLYVQMVTNAAEDSLHERILQGVYSKALTLGYPGIKTLKRVDLPAETEIERSDGLPALFISTFRIQATYTDMVNGHDDTGFPVLFMYAFPDALKDGPDPVVTLWQQITRRAFRSQRVPGVPESYNATVEPGPLGVVDLPDTNVPVKGSTQIVRVLTREPRGA